MMSLQQSSLSQRSTALGEVQVVVVAKEPLAGTVKTRLCPPLTSSEAASVAAAALADTLEVVGLSNCRATVVAFEGESDGWVPGGFIVVPQRRGGFGERLAGAMDDAWGRTRCPVLLIGMDTPQVTVSDLELAAAALLSPGVDAVLGAADDGGYWLIGVRRPEPGMFADVPMSTDHTASDQRRRLETLGLACRVIHGLRDVDTIADARAVAELVPNSSFATALRACAHHAAESNPA
jgi:rSAM/selenodomain-associated transferase 1